MARNRNKTVKKFPARGSEFSVSEIIPTLSSSTAHPFQPFYSSKLRLHQNCYIFLSKQSEGGTWAFLLVLSDGKGTVLEPSGLPLLVENLNGSALDFKPLKGHL